MLTVENFTVPVQKQFAPNGRAFLRPHDYGGSAKYGVRELALAFIRRAYCGPGAFADRGSPRRVSRAKSTVPGSTAPPTASRTSMEAKKNLIPVPRLEVGLSN
jgi:hypothetical protein